MKKESNWDKYPFKLGNHVRGLPLTPTKIENQWNCLKHHAKLHNMNPQNTLLYFAVDALQYL